MAETVKIVIEATDKASGPIKKVGESLNKVKKETKTTSLGFTELNSALALAQRVVAGVGQALDQTIGAWSKYAESMSKAAKNAGVTTEEMSRLTQAADDFRVEQGALESAMKLALKNGFVPTIENIAKLSDEFIAIKDPAERAEMASKIFGRSYAEITPMLLKGGDAIRAGTAAIADNLVVTAEATRANEKYIKAQDDLNDAWQGLKNQIGQVLIPYAAALMESVVAGDNFWETIKHISDETKEADPIVLAYTDRLQGMADAYNENKIAAEAQKTAEDQLYSDTLLARQKSYITAVEDGRVKVQKYTDELGNELRTMEELTLFLAGPLGNETEAFNEKQKDLADSAADIRAELAKLGVSEYLTDDQKAQIATLENKLYYANENLRDFTKKIDVDYKKAVNALDTDKLRELGFTEDEIESWESLRGESWKLEQAIRELGGQPYLTDAQKEQLETSKAKLKEIEEQTRKNADAHDEATKRILHDMLSQQLALDGLNQKEQDVLWELAKNWGLIDQETYNAWMGMKDYTDALTVAATPADILARKIALLSDKHIWITTTYIEEYGNAIEHGTALPPTHPGDQSDFVSPGAPPPIVNPLTYEQWKEEQGFARGANFIVPQNYPNDSYGPIYVESGEHVKITPANEVAKDMRTFNFNYSGNASAQQIRQSYEMARLLG